ncbi:MAG TPA: ABC transporter ATP-binding protein [Gaiellaceae bacterium]|nr:ABC transporter ATP-binding protein [Gaiellaceae bacterium]
MTDAIRTRGLTKVYRGGPTAVRELDLTVRVGEIFGFLGPNGAGKTTTIRILLDLLRPTAGAAEVLGLDARRAGVEARRRIGYLPGDLALYPKLTAQETLTYLGALRGGVPERRIAALSERLGLDLDRPVGTLSHGNRQKVGLVQAFMHEPELLVLDEPTGGLDPLLQQEFHRLVEEAAAAGRTVFLSSHVLSEVERVADRVGIIRAGSLVALEEIAALKQRATRRLDVELARPVDAAAFARLPNVRTADAERTLLHLVVEGPVDAVVKALAEHEVVSITSHEPDLEEVFLDYYREDGARAR